MPGLWICLVILHVWQAFEDATGSKYGRVLTMAQLYKQGLHRVLDMFENTSVCLNNACIASICLNAPQYAWTWLDIAGCSWMCLKIPEQTVLIMSGFSVCLMILDISQGFEYASGIKYALVLNILRYSYNNIVIVSNGSILEFLVAWCRNLGAQQLTVSFF